MNPRLPYRPQPTTARQKAFPLIPLLTACLVVVGALQGLRLAFEAGLFGEHKQSREGGVIAGVARMAPPSDGAFEVKRLPMTIQPHHLQFGAVGQPARHTLTVFTDPACGRCREQVAEWLRGVPLDGLKLVYVYWPMDKADVTSGMVLEIARRENVAQTLLNRLEKRRETFDSAGLMAQLESAGVPLARQQEYLKNDVEALGGVVSQDVELGTKLKLQEPPVLVLDDYLMDGRVLNAARVGTYIQRLDKREPILQANDYWLNKGL